MSNRIKSFMGLCALRVMILDQDQGRSRWVPIMNCDDFIDADQLLKPFKNCGTHHPAAGQPAGEDGNLREMDNCESDLKEGVNRVLAVQSMHAVAMEAKTDGMCVLVSEQAQLGSLRCTAIISLLLIL